MTSTVTFTFEGDHIRAVSRGRKTIDWSREFFTEMVRACEANDCYKVLSISESITTMPIMDGFDVVALFRELGINTKYRIAWVEVNPEAVKTLRFIDAALFNRLLPGRLFMTEADARKWLFGTRGY